MTNLSLCFIHRLSGRVAEESFYQDVNKVTVREASCADGSLSGSKHKIGKISTSDWLKHMKFKKSRDTSHPGIVQHMGSDASPEGTSKTASTESWLTTQNLKAHDSAHLAMNKDLQEGGLSVYEFHKNDFYDAMHMDCGLRKHVMELVQEETASNNVEIVLVVDQTNMNSPVLFQIIEVIMVRSGKTMVII